MAAMVGFSNSLGEEVGRYGIGVSLVCPSEVNTDYFERNDADMGWYPRMSQWFPVLEPEDVARRTVRAIRTNRREAIFPWEWRWPPGCTSDSRRWGSVFSKRSAWLVPSTRHPAGGAGGLANKARMTAWICTTDSAREPRSWSRWLTVSRTKSSVIDSSANSSRSGFRERI